MSVDQKTDGRTAGAHPAAAPMPAFLAPTAPQGAPSDQKAAPAARPGLIGRAFEALRNRAAAAKPPAQADAQGRYVLPAGSKVLRLPEVAGSPEAVRYCLVAQGLDLPAGGAAWLVSFEEGEDPTQGARPLRTVQGVLASRREARVRVVALLDEFGRAFAAQGPLAMPPARTPDVQLKRYADQEGRGCVEVAQDKGRPLRACEFEEGEGGISLVNSRVELGGGASGLPLVSAAAVAFLAFWLLPHEGGYSLAGVGVRDVLAKLRGSNVFEAAQAVVDAADEAQGRPNVLVPGLVGYAAQTLRDAGLDGVDPAGLGQPDTADALAQAGVPFLGAPIVLASSDSGQVPDIAQRIAAMIGGVLATGGVGGLTVLGRAGGAGQAQAPQVKLIRTTKYANAFYVAFDPAQVSGEGARMLLETEGLFNRLLGLQQAYGPDRLQLLSPGDAAALDAWCVDHALAAAAPYLDGTVGKVQPAPAGAPQLDVRLAFARGCECLRLPYRLEYGFDYDPQGRTLGVEVGAMPACVMPRVAWDDAAGRWAELPEAFREGLASRYAAFSLMAVAAVGFWACPDVEHVWVSARRGWGATQRIAEGERAEEPSLIIPGLGALSLPDEPDCVLSAQFDRARFEAALGTPRGRARCQADPFEALGEVPHVFGLGADGGLMGVKPLFDLGREPFATQDGAREVELDTRPLPEGAQGRLAARCVCDLGIFEGVARKEEARRIMESFEGDDSLAAIAQARQACARTESPLMRAALMRVIEGIATDRIEADSHDEVAAMLDDVYGLQASMERASQAVGAKPREARRILEEAVDEADANGWFADSPTRCFRYFDSYAARALYGLRCADDLAGRELALCADEYYMAHYRLSTLLGDDLETCEEAIQHARRCVELAPGVAASHLRLARCYFTSFDYASQIEALKRAMGVIWNPKDMGLALYWLGYALCMTGQVDAGMACYQRCSTYDRSLADIASNELADFVKRAGCEPKTFTEREAQLALEAVGVDLGAFRRNTDALVGAAADVLEAGNKGLAYKLLGAAGVAMHDDAVAPVLGSLEV